MPYIKQEDRSKFEGKARELGDLVECAGDINFTVTEIVHAYLSKNGVNYAKINEVIGALECIKLELYRRLAVPYEDTKIKQNGDVGVLQFHIADLEEKGKSDGDR